MVLLALTLLAGCTTVTGPTPTETTEPTTPVLTTSTPGPTGGASPDEPPLDFDGGDATLGPKEPPHVVRLVNDGDATRSVTLTVVRDGDTVFEQSYRSFPNTTILGEVDRRGNYSLTVTVRDGGTVTETLTASSFDCNYSTTTFDLSDSDPTVRTVSTEMACDTSTEDGYCSTRWQFLHPLRAHAVGEQIVMSVSLSSAMRTYTRVGDRR